MNRYSWTSNWDESESSQSHVKEPCAEFQHSLTINICSEEFKGRGETYAVSAPARVEFHQPSFLRPNNCALQQRHK